MKRALIILYLVACVIIGALGDALYDEGIKVWAHSIEVLWGAMLLFAFPILKPHNWKAFVAALIAWNVVLFDTAYNLFRHLPIDYIGSTSLWDKFFSNYPIQGLLWVKFIFLILAVSLHIKYLKDD